LVTWFRLAPFIIGLFFFFCSRQHPASPSETILAKIGDRTISREEFISRAEYAIRPAYCKSDQYVHRKIALNSLIAEKLLAIEAGDDNPLSRNEQFQLYVQGRKEQSMRQWLYYQDFYSRARADSGELRLQMSLSGRTYRVAYLTLSDSLAAKQAGQWLCHPGASVSNLYKQLSGSATAPEREISWSSPEPENVIHALFNEPMTRGLIIGPVEAEGKYLFIEILGWTDRVAVTEAEKERRFQDARQRILIEKAGADYERYLRELMKGKVLNFNRDTFPRVVRTLGDFLLTSTEDKDHMLQVQVWDDTSDARPAMRSSASLDDIADAPFLTDGDLNWTVRDFQHALLSHPLVFRKHKMKKSEFAAELQKAIADLVQDHYVTRDTYRKGYDRVNLVERNAGMWRDYLLSFYQRNRILGQDVLAATQLKDFMPLLRKDLDPYVAGLFKKYSDQIQIDTDVFEKIKLSSIDMTVIQKDVPYPIMVPAFPILTTHSQLDYGKKMHP